MKGQELIGEKHLRRKAVVYVRQSSPQQVRENRESGRLQYRLRELAERLGWSAERIETVDEDQGVSGGGLEERAGFEHVTRDVAGALVGALFGLDATRLSRNTPEWSVLLRCMELTDTLLVEDGQIYDLADPNDSFVQTIKGAVAARDRYVTVKRMQAAKHLKATRGELYTSLPIGYVLDGVRLRKDPDEQVQHAIGEVFAQFEQAGSARRTALALREAGVRLPARPEGRNGPVRWREATFDRVRHILTNPAMGGAYVHGRQRTVVRLDKRGRPRKQTALLPRERWRVVLEDRHEGYVEWSRWLSVQERLRANSPRDGQAAPREGWALLQGVALCGHCGHALSVRYGGSGSYVCRPSKEAGRGRQLCQTMNAARVDKAVAEALLEMVRPGSVEGALRAEKLAAERGARQLRSYQLEVERRQYECDRAEREYRKVEPEYRLVKRTLARDWERTLERLERARAELEQAERRVPPPLELPAAASFAGLGERLRQVWEHPAVSMRDRKRLLRTVLEAAILRRDREAARLHLLLHWRGGWVDEFELPWPKRWPEPVRDDTDTVELVRRLAGQCGDVQIARTLNRQGRLTATGLRFTAQRVRGLRRRHKVPAFRAGASDGERQLRSVLEAAQELGVSRNTVYRWLKEGFLVGEQAAGGAPLRVWVDEALRSRLCESVPEGYLPHAEALRLTGVSRETLRQRIRNGRVETRWVRRGPSKGLYVRLELPSEPWLEGLEITADEPGLEPETDREGESA